MHITPHLMQLADSIHAERTCSPGGCANREQGPALRTRLGRRLITLGERMAYGETAPVGR